MCVFTIIHELFVFVETIATFGLEDSFLWDACALQVKTVCMYLPLFGSDIACSILNCQTATSCSKINPKINR